MKTFFLLLLLLGAGNVSAASMKGTVIPQDTRSVFESVIPIVASVSLPTVLEVAVSDPAFRSGDFAVYEETSKTFQPASYGEKAQAVPVAFSETSDSTPTFGALNSLTDKAQSFVEFPVSADAEKNSVTIDFKATRLMAVSGILLQLEPYVALPRAVEISAVDASGNASIVLAKTAIYDRTIRFPKTTSDYLRIYFEYSQPLRIQEISFFSEEALRLEGRYVRFLARPGEKYALYFRSDRPFTLPVGERPNLSDDRDVKRVGNLVAEKNVLYVPADGDKDGVTDKLDNCISAANSDQEDENKNGRGDICDDYDKDGIMNSKDNCPSYPNHNQQDTDGDDKGDACDTEESRITESNPWLPWVAMGLGTLVVVGLFMATLRGKRR